MKLDKQDYLATLIECVDGLQEFISNHPHIQLSEIIELFRKEKNIDSELSLRLSIIEEKAYSIFPTLDNIEFINPSLVVNDSIILLSFLHDSQCKKQKYIFKNAEVQHYKTTTEKIAFQEVDFNGLLDKYDNCNHPFIYSEIALAYLNSEQYDIGLRFLQKALNYVFSSPNVFWHNHLAIYGCTDALYELQHQLGRKAMFDVSNALFHDQFAILRCLYLYLSRSIYMSKGHNEKGKDVVSSEIINKSNYLSMRGDLEYDYRQDFMYIFPFGTNPDIQYISDKNLAYSVVDEIGLGLLAKESLLDSEKMYRHGSLIPNNSGGYQEIEDATYAELIQRGEIRSLSFSNDLYSEYQDGNFMLSKSDVANCIEYIMHLKTQK